MAAFANSGDGTIFIGIGQIKGIPAAGPKERDQLSQRIYQLVRQRIKPTPSIRVDFAEVKGYTVCTLFVPRGEEPLHFLDGVIYLRYGSSDIKAQPEMVKKASCGACLRRNDRRSRPGGSCQIASEWLHLSMDRRVWAVVVP